MLDERISEAFEWEDNNQTFREYIHDLEKMSGVKEHNIDSMTNEEILKYIDSLWIIAVVY